MHIAHFTNTYKPNINGVVRSISTFRQALTRLGHQTFIFAPEARNYEEEEPFVFRYPAIDLPRFDYSFPLPVSPHIDWVFPILKPDVIHSHHPVVLGQVAADKAEKYNLPLVFTFHTRYTSYSYIVPFSEAFVNGIIVEWLAHYIQRCQHVITPSDGIGRMLRDYGGIRERITTIPTGIDLTPFQQADSSPIRHRYGLEQLRVLVTLGRLSMEKNWKTLLAAFAQVVQQQSDVRLIMIGDGPMREELEEYIEALGIKEHVILTGLLPFEQIPAHLKAGDLFCFASVKETQGLVIMEALAAGLPVVAVKSTGVNEVVHDGMQGLLTKEDSSELAKAMLLLLENEDLRKRLRSGALTKARTFDSRKQAERLLAVYEQAIEDKRAGHHVPVNRELLKEHRRQLGRALASG